MKKLAIITMGAMLAAGAASAQTTGTAGGDANRTGQVQRGAGDMQTTTPGTGTDTTHQHPGTQTAPGTDPFEGIEAAEPGTGTEADRMDTTQQPGTTAVQPGTTATQPGTTGTWEQQQSGTMQQQQQQQQQQQVDPYGTSQPRVVPGQPGTADRSMADESQQQTGAGTAERRMPATASNWLGMLFGGGLLSAAGFALRRRK